MIIETIAGNGNADWETFQGSVSALKSPLSSPAALAFDSKGNLYISSQVYSAIRMLDKKGDLHTIAGGYNGYSDKDGILAKNASIKVPCGIAVDSFDNIYFSDSNDYRVRKIDNNGIITTIAGTGEIGDSGDGGLAVNARMHPTGVAVDKNGVVYISDRDHYKIRKIDKNGIITTIAGTGEVGWDGDGGPN